MRAALATRSVQGLSQLPRVPGYWGDRRPLHHPRRVPIEIPTSLPGRLRMEDDSCPSPLETWWSLEDLWLRLHQADRLRVVDSNTLLLPNWRHWQADPALRAAVFDVQRYAWSSSSRPERGSFVRTLEYAGDDLVCRLTPAAAVQGWPDGPTLVLLRAALFVRLSSHTSHQGGEA